MKEKNIKPYIYNQVTKEELESVSSSSMFHYTIRFLIIAFIFAFCIFLSHLSPLKRYLSNVHEIKYNLLSTGYWAPIIFLLISSILIASGFPRLLFCTISGIVFGVLCGFILSQFSSMIGAYGTFIFSRWGGKELAQRIIQRYPKFHFVREQPSVPTVFLIRQLPIAGVISNFLFGLSNVNHRTFLIGSFIGMLPYGLVATLLGSSIAKSDFSDAIIQLLSAFFFILISLYGIWRLKKRFSSKAKFKKK